MAPEILAEELKFSVGADCYAFAVLVNELLAEERPYHGLALNGELIERIIGQDQRPLLFNQTRGREGAGKNRFQHYLLAGMIVKGWGKDVNNRVKMLNDAQELQHMLAIHPIHANTIKTKPYSHLKLCLIISMCLAVLSISVYYTTRKLSNPINLSSVVHLSTSEQTMSKSKTKTKKKAESFLYFTLAVQKSNTEALYDLAQMYRKDCNVRSKNLSKACLLYRRAAKQWHVPSMVELAQCIMRREGERKGTNSAVEWLRRAANEGNLDAEYLLGRYYETQRDSVPRYGEALERYATAASHNHAKAMYRIGNLYDEGLGVGTNHTEAMQWYKRAAQLDQAEACYTLGQRFLTSQRGSVEQNYSEAFYWSNRAARQGYAEAINALGKLYQQGLGVEQNSRKALHLFEQAAEQGHVEALYNIALFYHRDQGNHSLALSYYSTAAEKGHIQSALHLARVYKKGLYSLQVNHSKAFEFYHFTALSGNVKGEYHIGRCYNKGEGVKKDYQEAARWFAKAAERGHAAAQSRLGYMYETGKGVETKDISKALALYCKSAQQSHRSALNHLASCYASGEGVTQDLALAFNLSRQAAEKGPRSAHYDLPMCCIEVTNAV